MQRTLKKIATIFIAGTLTLAFQFQLMAEKAKITPEITTEVVNEEVSKRSLSRNNGQKNTYVNTKVKYTDTLESNYKDINRIISTDYEKIGDNKEIATTVFEDADGNEVIHTLEVEIKVNEEEDASEISVNPYSDIIGVAAIASGTTTAKQTFKQTGRYTISGSVEFGWDGSSAWVNSNSWTKSTESGYTLSKFDKFSDSGLGLIKANAGVDYYGYFTKNSVLYNSGTYRFWCSKTGGIS